VVLDSAMPFGQRPFSPWQASAAALFFVSGACGCQPECGEKQEIRYEEGLTDPTHTVYQTTPILGPWLHFPAQRTYKLVHDLRTFPIDVNLSLAFDERNENLAPAAGNQAVWHVDPTTGEIYVKNDSCAEFYVYVVAYAAPDPGPGADDAGSD
jgi:hypothetical protein